MREESTAVSPTKLLAPSRDHSQVTPARVKPESTAAGRDRTSEQVESSTKVSAQLTNLPLGDAVALVGPFSSDVIAIDEHDYEVAATLALKMISFAGLRRQCGKRRISGVTTCLCGAGQAYFGSGSTVPAA
ncbi:hypothetical protein BU24DRAFT_467186 [Aaosphaeria arxii CBS 175.79]|uniref:Uncharacterized protein n=1 Tax=Aaosphaeria arxii CBS 175.79 TaxID=1450172 RepID=A0A6A5XCC5_9PLEO|nr:uncharacterized protein BU24DRAFT_467186 [Aaosphaeria arxii CBS 175.79]KAF2010570.1 hypothetical protein BU24DRAFT_467186 [Aaosphaeria arxii CBS 175.79]